MATEPETMHAQVERLAKETVRLKFLLDSPSPVVGNAIRRLADATMVFSGDSDVEIIERVIRRVEEMKTDNLGLFERMTKAESALSQLHKAPHFEAPRSARILEG